MSAIKEPTLTSTREPEIKSVKLRFEDFEVDLTARRLTRSGVLIPLDPESFDLLAILLSSAPDGISESGLVEFLWPGQPVERSNLGQHIFLLRRALGGASRGEKIIVATADQGYCLNGRVESVEQPARTPEDPDLNRNSPEQAQSMTLDGDAIESSQSRRPGSIQRERGRKINEDDAESRSNALGLLLKRASAAVRSTSRPVLFASAAGLVVVFTAFVVPWTLLHRRPAPAVHLVVAGLQNETLDPQFDQSVRTALAVDLRQSPHLILASEADIVAALVRMNGASTEGPQPSRASAIPQALCRELHGDAYLTGDLRHLGQKYLISLAVYDCATARETASVRGVADTPEHLIGILDRAALELRRQLGEESHSLKSFTQPFFANAAASMPALKAYADGLALALDNRPGDAIPLLQRALSIDNHLPQAEEQLGRLAANTGNHAEAADHFTRAYNLRGYANAFDRYGIEIRYDLQVTGDLSAAARSAREAAESYPASAGFLQSLAEIEDRSGKAAQALDPARKAFSLDPSNPRSYEVLAAAEMHLAQFDEAALTCRRAISRHIDTAIIRSILLQIAFQRLDQTAIDEQIAWAKDNPAAALILADQGWMELSEGKANAAQKLFTQAITAYSQQGNREDAAALQAAIPRRLVDLGLTSAATARLARLDHSVEYPDMAVAEGELGNTARASSLIDQAIAAHPTSSLVQQVHAPQVRAAIALANHNPQAALDALQAATAFDRATFDLPLMRGRALLAQHHPEEAETEFHKILDHPGIDPLSLDYPLAQLGLARALAEEGKAVDASFAYKIVLAIWKDGDSDLPRLRDVRAEAARH